MTIDETIQKLIEMKLHTLAKSLREMLDMPPDDRIDSDVTERAPWLPPSTWKR